MHLHLLRPGQSRGGVSASTESASRTYTREVMPCFISVNESCVMRCNASNKFITPSTQLVANLVIASAMSVPSGASSTSSATPSDAASESTSVASASTTTLASPCSMTSPGSGPTPISSSTVRSPQNKIGQYGQCHNVTRIRNASVNRKQMLVFVFGVFAKPLNPKRYKSNVRSRTTKI